MTSDGTGRNAAKSYLMLKGTLTKHLIGGGGSKNEQNDVTPYMDGP